MIIRIIGAILIIIGCGSFGILLASNHRYQAKTLRQFTMILDFMECELQYRQTPLPELCQMSALGTDGLNRKIFSALSSELENQISPDVEKCVSAVIQSMDSIPEKIKKCFLLFGQSLGRFDLDGQIKGIEMTKSEVNRILQEHTENQTNRIRCYQTLSICGGAAVAILFI